jgi:phospholipid/cholesterol/gamma-HCH transport system substrate-binding protein
MDTNVNYTIIGIFVITLTAFVILAVIWLSAGFSIDKYVVYKVYMTESVSGLNIDSPVEYNGVNVGSVKSIELNETNPRLVELLLEIKKTTPITQATIATLNVKGLTGIGYLALQNKEGDNTPLVALQGQEYPVIKTGPSLLLRMDKAITALNESVHQVSESIHMLLDKENLRSIKDTLISIQKITGTWAANTEQMNTLFHNSANASRQFLPLMQSTSNGMQLLINQTLPAANDAVANFSAVSRELKQNPAVLIRGKTPRTLGPGE